MVFVPIGDIPHVNCSSKRNFIQRNSVPCNSGDRCSLDHYCDITLKNRFKSLSEVENYNPNALSVAECVNTTGKTKKVKPNRKNHLFKGTSRKRRVK